mmetsp:Transcript_11018/g.44980  ORF Transcript_11018/g.44980 Transcript_11018/m.44980 type:complete len:364 (+) Transcript_11018:287-1378(+)
MEFDEPPKTVCEECGGTAFREDWHVGDTICKACGWVLPDRLVDLGEEKRNFSANHTTLGWSSNNRSAALDAYTGAMSTTIVGDGAGKLLQLQNQHSGQGAYKEKQVQDGVNSIAQVCGLYNLRLSQRVKNAASRLWVEFERNRRKYSRTADLNMYTAVIYEACKQEGQNRTYKELAKAVGEEVDVKNVSKCHKRLVMVLKETKARPEAGRGTGTPVQHPLWSRPGTPGTPHSPGTPVTPVAGVGTPETPAVVAAAATPGVTPTSLAVNELLSRICDSLKLQQKFVRKAMRLVPHAAAHLEGRRPVTITVAVILFVAKHCPDLVDGALPDRKIAQAARVAAGTMRTAYKMLEAHLEELMTAISE